MRLTSLTAYGTLFFMALTLNGFATQTARSQDTAGTNQADDQSIDEASKKAAGETPSPDTSANDLNAQQQLKQTFTLTRKVNGVLVDEEKRTVTYTDDDPVQPTEASQSPLEELRARFDRELITREEARETAKLDFVLADVDRDGAMSIDEFVRLTDMWASRASEPGAQTNGAAKMAMAVAEKKFTAMTTAMRQTAETASATLSKQDYMDAVLADFDAADTDSNGLLREVEIITFRERMTAPKE